MLVTRLLEVHVDDRPQYILQNAQELDNLTPGQLEVIATILLRSSDPEIRKKYPVVGDRNRRKPAWFEERFKLSGFKEPE